VTRLARPILSAVLVLVLLPLAAFARDLRHPASGEPAFTITVPDDWTAVTVDGGKSLGIASADRRIGFALTVATTDQSLEEIAKSAITATKATQLEARPTSISGFAGRTYSWTYVNAGGIKLHTTMTLVQLDGHWLASCTKLEVDGNSPAAQQLADTAMQSVKLVKGAK
jgi:hypothetical protein